ncbi:hypothetical protein WS54_08770 [Burkholderia sp. NRF60-BP8]|nr:hypothetical protein WS54_08770 [Burkholderia sp. NRF60-BP8]KVA14784.1 hypothetical protein WS54_11875 [Burkholderia sp. NRF60-BP8]
MPHARRGVDNAASPQPGVDVFSMPGWRSMQRSPNGVSHGASNAHSSSNATSASTLAGWRDSF